MWELSTSGPLQTELSASATSSTTPPMPRHISINPNSNDHHCQPSSSNKGFVHKGRKDRRGTRRNQKMGRRDRKGPVATATTHNMLHSSLLWQTPVRNAGAYERALFAEAYTGAKQDQQDRRDHKDRRGARRNQKRGRRDRKGPLAKEQILSVCWGYFSHPCL